MAARTGPARERRLVVVWRPGIRPPSVGLAAQNSQVIPGFGVDSHSTRYDSPKVSRIRSPPGHSGGGRCSYGVERTIVVRVVTLAAARIRASNSSSAVGD